MLAVVPPQEEFSAIDVLPPPDFAALLDGKVDVAGDTMTGDLILNSDLRTNGNVGINCDPTDLWSNTISFLEMKGKSSGSLIRMEDSTGASTVHMFTDINGFSFATLEAKRMMFSTNSTGRFCITAEGNTQVGAVDGVPANYISYDSGWRVLEVKGGSVAGGGVLSTTNSDASVRTELYSDNLGGRLRTLTNNPLLLMTNGIGRLLLTAAGDIQLGDINNSPLSYGGGWRTVEARGATTTNGGIFSSTTSDGSVRGEFFSVAGGAILRTITNHVLGFQTNGVGVGEFATNGAFRHVKLFGQMANISNGTVSGAVTIDCNSGNDQSFTMSGSVTLTFTQPAQDGTYQMRLVIAQNATGGYSVTWPGAFKWAGGFPPYIGTAASQISIVTLHIVVSGGAAGYYGSGLSF